MNEEKNVRKLWYTLAGLVVIGLIIAGVGWYIEKHRMRLLEERLATLEKRVNSETAWGRKVSRWVEGQKTTLKYDRSVFAPMWYSVRNDTIFINDDLYASIKVSVKTDQKGDLYAFIMRFHEELHRAQEMKSKWGELWRFLERTNQMDTYFHRPGEEAHVGATQASNEQWLNLSHTLTGSTHLNALDAALEIKQWREQMSKTKPERNLLKETHAYWISYVTTIDDLYRHLYQHPHGSYTDLQRVDKLRFAELCVTMDWLYAAYDGNLDKLAAFVGNANSLNDFEQKAIAFIGSYDMNILKARRKQMWKEKREWQETTALLAQEILGR